MICRSLPLVAVLVAGCASIPERETRGATPPAGPPPGQLFLSPSGEPFRAAGATAYPVSTWFEKADTNADGHISRDELWNDAFAFFRRVDLNQDGAIDGDEVSNYERVIAPEIRLMSPPAALPRPRFGPPPGGDPSSGPPPGGRLPRAGRFAQAPQGAAMFSLINEPQPLRAADADLSMRVTVPEWRRATDRRFSQLDRDADGRVRFQELPMTPFQRITRAR